MIALLALGAMFVVLLALVAWQRHRIMGWLIVNPPPVGENVINPADDPLLGSIEMLSRRVTLAEAINKTLRRVVTVLVPVVVVLVPVAIVSLVLLARTTHQSDVNHDRAVEAKATAELAQQAIDQLNADRAKNSRGSCIQYNVQQQQRRDGNVHLLIEGFRPLATTPESMQKLVELEGRLIEIAAATWPYRDCSDAGIEAFLKNPPQDPAAGG